MVPKSAVAAFMGAAALAGAVLVGCGDDSSGDRSEGRYCTEVGNHLSALNSPVLAAGSDVSAMLADWRAVADVAPLAVESEWKAMIRTVETASTVDVNDAASMQKVADTARENQKAADRIIDYTFKKCGATIGGVTPVSTQAPATSTTDG